MSPSPFSAQQTAKWKAIPCHSPDVQLYFALTVADCDATSQSDCVRELIRSETLKEDCIREPNVPGDVPYSYTCSINRMYEGRVCCFVGSSSSCETFPQPLCKCYSIILLLRSTHSNFFPGLEMHAPQPIMAALALTCCVHLLDTTIIPPDLLSTAPSNSPLDQSPTGKSSQEVVAHNYCLCMPYSTATHHDIVICEQLCLYCQHLYLPPVAVPA